MPTARQHDRQHIRTDTAAVWAKFDKYMGAVDVVDEEIMVAGQRVTSSRDIIIDYAAQFGRTLARYDFGDRGAPNILTGEEIWATRVISSRVARAERDELERAAAEWAPLWAEIPLDANLRDADPSVADGLYMKMQELYTRCTQVHGISTAKASKILHFKRPHLYPILDSRLIGLYRESASQAAKEYPKLGHKKMYWAAIRNDLLTNEMSLRALRTELSRVRSPFKLSHLTDLRILDILSWSR